MSLTVILEMLAVIGGTVGVMLAVVAFLGLVVQTVAEFLFGKMEGILKTIFPGLDGLLGKKDFRVGLIALLTCGVGIWAAFLYQLDVVYLVASLMAGMAAVGVPVQITFFGLLVTGIMIGMGAGYIHDLIIKPLLNHANTSTQEN